MEGNYEIIEFAKIKLSYEPQKIYHRDPEDATERSFY